MEVQKTSGETTQTVAKYVYDPDGNRIWAEYDDGTSRTYHFDLTGQVTENPIMEAPSAGPHRNYIYLNRKLLARVDGTIESGTKYWFMTDHLGSARGMTDEAGSVVWQADYEAFGKVKGAPGPLEVPRFTGKAWDEHVGLYYFNARWYDAGLGRFVGEDALRDPNYPNLHAYCSSNPLSYTDPTGHMADPGGGGGGGAAGGGTPPDTMSSESEPLSTVPQDPASLDQDVSNLSSEEIEKALRAAYGDAAVDIVHTTIGDQDLGEFMRSNGIKSIIDLALFMHNQYADENARRTLIAELGFARYESTRTKATPEGNGLETTAYTAEACWFLAGGKREQFADDFVVAFNLDINGDLIPGGSVGRKEWNIRSRVHDKYGDEYVEKYLLLPSTGFRDCYLDRKRLQDQAHHFSAFLHMAVELGSDSLGYSFGGGLVFYWSIINELGTNWGDIRLGWVAEEAARSIEFWKSPGVWIRKHMGY